MRIDPSTDIYNRYRSRASDITCSLFPQRACTALQMGAQALPDGRNIVIRVMARFCCEVLRNLCELAQHLCGAQSVYRLEVLEMMMSQASNGSSEQLVGRLAHPSYNSATWTELSPTSLMSQLRARLLAGCLPRRRQGPHSRAHVPAQPQESRTWMQNGCCNILPYCK